MVFRGEEDRVVDDVGGTEASGPAPSLVRGVARPADPLLGALSSLCRHHHFRGGVTDKALPQIFRDLQTQ